MAMRQHSELVIRVDDERLYQAARRPGLCDMMPHKWMLPRVFHKGPEEGHQIMGAVSCGQQWRGLHGKAEEACESHNFMQRMQTLKRIAERFC